MGRAPAAKLSRLARQFHLLTSRLDIGQRVLLALRYTWASNLVAAGLPPLVLAAIGGWSSASLPGHKFHLSSDAILRAYRKAMEQIRQEDASENISERK
ncbi:MAG: hypothetical protein WBW69_03190 [Candidatus Korobacteraceae bacterium]